MKILVTGGAGFIGSNIVDELIKTKFPLDNSAYDFQIGKKYNIDMIDPSKLYKHQIQNIIMLYKKKFHIS